MTPAPTGQSFSELLAQLKATDKPFLIPREVAPLLGCKVYAVNLAAQQDPKKLGFPVCIIGTRVKIPRIPFLKFIEGETV